MSAVERLEDGLGGTPPRRDGEPTEASAIGTELAEPASRRRPRLRPLLALAPYVGRYRGRAFLALIALTVAAITTLVVPGNLSDLASVISMATSIVRGTPAA